MTKHVQIDGKLIDVERTLFEIERADAEVSLVEFVRQAWHIIEPGQPYVHGWHIDFICTHLEAITDGVELEGGEPYNRLLINVPPGPGWVENLVTTARGRVRLGDLMVGDMVLTHRGRYRPVTACYPKGILPTLRITTKGGRETIATPDHNFLTPGGWVEAGRLRVGDTLAFVTPVEDHCVGTVSPEEARLLGYLIGDGSMTQATVGFTNQDEDVVADFESCASFLGFKTTKTLRKTHWQVRLNGGASVRAWLASYGLCGVSSYTKFIPQAVISSSSVIIKNFIGAYWSCDGMFDVRSTQARGSRYRASATTVSERLARDLQHALSRIGIRSLLRKKSRVLDTAAQPGGVYRSFNIEVYSEADTARFIDMPGLSARKNKIASACSQRRFDTVLNDDPIVSIEPAGDRECMCVSVEEDHSLVWDDIVVHNTMKSLLSNVFWPAWWWGPRNEPYKRFLCASHSQSLAIRDSTKMRRLIASQWYQERWGDRVTLTGDQNAKTKFETTATGFREAVAAGSITGSRGDVVIIDDPHSVEGAASDAMRQSTLEWFTEAVPTRLNNPRNSAIVVIMQRLHEEDVSGVIINRKLGYDHIMLPMRFEPGRAKATMLGISDPREEEGELLFPDRFPEDVVDRDERVMGPYACNTAEAPVLMSDLSMKRIDQVREGDEVLGWVRDEGGRSRMVRTRVKQSFKYHGTVVKMTLDSGQVIRCTPDHKWWRARWEKGRNEYAPAKVGTSLARVCPPSLPELSPDDLRLAGWLSGFFDGEGTVSVCKKNGSGNYQPSQQIHFYQGSGRNLPLCEKLEQALTHFGFSFRYHEDKRKPNKDAPCYGYRTYNLISGQQSLGLAQRFLHVVQPTKWRNRIEDMALGAKFVQGWEKVVSIEPDGQEPVYALETETGNYVVWGICSSNSAGQHQQNPEPRGGGIIKRAWWRRWDRPAYPPFSYVVAALDTAYTEKEENDPSAMTVWGIFSGGDQTAQITRSVNRHDEAMQMAERAYTAEHPKAMLIYAWTERLELHDLVEKVRETVGDYGVDHLLIEDRAAGHSVAQELRRIYGYDDFGVQLVNPGKADKVARLYSVQHLFADGLVYAPERTWAEAVINQVAQFPKGKHDDLTDTLSMAMKYLRESGLIVRSSEHSSALDSSRLLEDKPGPLYPV